MFSMTCCGNCPMAVDLWFVKETGPRCFTHSNSEGQFRESMIWTHPVRCLVFGIVGYRHDVSTLFQFPRQQGGPQGKAGRVAQKLEWACPSGPLLRKSDCLPEMVVRYCCQHSGSDFLLWSPGSEADFSHVEPDLRHLPQGSDLLRSEPLCTREWCGP